MQNAGPVPRRRWRNAPTSRSHGRNPVGFDVPRVRHAYCNEHGAVPLVRTGLLLVASLVTQSIAFAQSTQADVGATRLTLDAAFAEALERNLTLIATRAGITIAEANLITAGLRPNPVLSLSADLSVLRRLANDVLKVVTTVRGAADMSIEQEADQAQLRIAVDRGVLARYGLNVSDIQDVIELAIGGRTVGAVFEGERRFDVTVRYTPEARADPAAIGQMLVAAPSGERVPLGQLARVETVRGPSIIARRENERQITVRTNIRDRDQGGFVSEAQAKVAAALKLPSGYRVSWGGQFENLARARARLVLILPVTILIVFGLLFVAFASVRDAALVLVNVPFSLIGGILALYLRSIHLSVSAAVGFVTLFGVAVMGGLLYVAEINRRLSEPGASLRDAVVSGAKSQVRPMFMLIVVAMLGMIPAATATGIGSDIQRPLATVIVGGLASTLLLTLLVLPSLYYVTAGRRYQASRLDELFGERHDR